MCGDKFRSREEAKVATRSMFRYGIGPPELLDDGAFFPTNEAMYLLTRLASRLD
jgi:hypothetical protein